MHTQLNSSSSALGVRPVVGEPGASAVQRQSSTLTHNPSSLQSCKEGEQGCFSSFLSSIWDGLAYIGSWIGYIVTCGCYCRSAEGTEDKKDVTLAVLKDHQEQMKALKESFVMAHNEMDQTEFLAWWEKEFGDLPAELRDRIVFLDMAWVMADQLEKEWPEFVQELDDTELQAKLRARDEDALAQYGMEVMHRTVSGKEDEAVVVPTKARVDEEVAKVEGEWRGIHMEYVMLKDIPVNKEFVEPFERVSRLLDETIYRIQVDIDRHTLNN